MLRVQVIVLEVLEQLRPALAPIARKDPALESQIRRAATSIALNLAEGVGSFGGVKKQRYRTALGSLDEVRMALLASVALGYVASIDASLSQKIDEAGRMLAGLARR